MRGARSRATFLVVWLVGITAAVPAVGFGQSARFFDPLQDRIVYDLIDALNARGWPTGGFLTAKPWSSRDLVRFLARSDSVAGTRAISEFESLALDRLREEVRFLRARERNHAGVAGLDHLLTVHPRIELAAAAGEWELDPPFRSVRRREELGDPDAAIGGSVEAGYSWLPRNLSVALYLRGSSDTRNRFDFRDRDEDGSLDVRSAYLLWEGDPLELAVGRLPVEWGNGPARGLGLSASGPSLDGLLARARIGLAQVTIVSAFLEDELANRRLDARGETIQSSAPTGSPPAVDRYFHGHRLDLRLGDRLEIGVNEHALVTGVDRRPDLRFLTGLMPYFSMQEEEDEVDGEDINLGAGGQYRLRIGEGVVLYGEFFANEVFLDTDVGEVIRGIRGERTNTQGFQQGVRWARALGIAGLDLEAEWVRLEHFVFLHRGLNTVWRRNGAPVGTFLGPDLQRTTVSGRYVRELGSGLAIGTAGLSWRERGVGRISDEEDIQGLGGARPTPRGFLERTWRLDLGVTGWWPRFGTAGIRATYAAIDGLNNLPFAEENVLDLEIFVSLGPRVSRAF